MSEDDDEIEIDFNAVADFLDAGDAEPTTADAMVNAAEPKTVRRKKKRIQFEREQAQDFYRRTFADPIGRREMWEILKACHWSETKFACGPNGSPQTEATFFHAGEQSIGDRLFHSWMALDRAGVMLMLDEHDPRFANPSRPKRA